MSRQQSMIYVCSGVRLDNRYDHSIFFESAYQQKSYFAGKVVRTFSAYSFLRKSWPLQVAATMEDAKTWNYLYFQNTDTSKTYYYFITNVEYKNDGMVELRLELDVLQTYLFDWEFLPSFVERTHTQSDNVGEHTLDEGLDMGELVSSGVRNFDAISECCILVLSSFNPNYSETEKPVPALAGLYDGVFSGLKVWAVNSSDWVAWGAKLDDLSAAGFIDGIVAMWMYPKNLVVLGGENTWSDDDLCKTVAGCKDGGLILNLNTSPSALAGYEPRNKKLLCYPFNMLYVTNNMGTSAVYRFERFGSGSAHDFICQGSLAADGVVKMYPANYNGSAKAYDEGLTLPGFPSCSWDADVYKMWLAQNQNQHAFADKTARVTAAVGAGVAIGSLLTGNLAGMAGGAMTAVSGLKQVHELAAQKADMEIQPPQSRGSFSASVNMTSGMHTFTFMQKCVGAEHARVIDDFFDMYGYKVSRIMTPSINVRPRWTYLKTVNCQIATSICNEDRVLIEGIFDRGITFWKNGDRVSDYSNPAENKA